MKKLEATPTFIFSSFLKVIIVHIFLEGFNSLLSGILRLCRHLRGVPGNLQVHLLPGGQRCVLHRGGAPHGHHL